MIVIRWVGVVRWLVGGMRGGGGGRVLSIVPVTKILPVAFNSDV